MLTGEIASAVNRELAYFDAKDAREVEADLAGGRTGHSNLIGGALPKNGPAGATRRVTFY